MGRGVGDESLALVQKVQRMADLVIPNKMATHAGTRPKQQILHQDGDHRTRSAVG